ncbi:AraC family transcriptional regulator [Paraburkholderia tropica]|uniref:AraC family transcriptional regulator n=1 Tax=Paraburkholderia tropica TaxID=92647 RepID=UPI0007ECD90D|nr:helix-turn-helix transcriptional regulator [Paraburkholderia tropica]OBR50058.1 AraC family transcriptional regulator [Paraburkholderia tropica]
MDEIWRRRFGFRYKKMNRPVIAHSYEYRDGDRQSWHTHEQAQFVFSLRGVLRVVTPIAVWSLGPRRGLWIGSGVAHELHAVGDVSMRSVYFEPEVSPWIGTDCRVLIVPALLQELVATVVEMGVESDDERYSLVMPLLLKEMKDARSAAAASLALPQDRRLRQVCEALITDPANNEPLANWGNRVGASERTLARLYREETGLTFVQWRQQLRLVESMSRLAKGSSVAAVASDLGYGNSSAFIAMFRKATGQTPQRYVKS